MHVPIWLCGEEAETDQEHLDKNGYGEQPGNNQVEHPYPCTDHVVSPLRAQMARFYSRTAIQFLPSSLCEGRTQRLERVIEKIVGTRFGGDVACCVHHDSPGIDDDDPLTWSHYLEVQARNGGRVVRQVEGDIPVAIVGK